MPAYSTDKGFTGSGSAWGGNRANNKPNGSGVKKDKLTGVGFGLSSKPMSPESMAFTGEKLDMLVQKDYKPTEKGAKKAGNVFQKKPGETDMSHDETFNNTKPLSDVEKAVLESRRQRRVQSTGLDVAQTIMGLAPAPGLGAAFGLGRWMGKKAEDEAMSNPDRFTTIPGDPGAIRSVKGPLTSNRALPTPSAKSTQASTDEEIKRKKKQVQTVLGAGVAPLGTITNPAPI